MAPGPYWASRYSLPVNRLRNVAVVLAGGTGTRVGLNIPKQLIKIAGKPIIEHTIAAMQASPLVDEIIVMMAPGYLDDVRAIVTKRRLRQGQPDPRGAPAPGTTPRPRRWPRSATRSATSCCTTRSARWSPRRSSPPTSRRCRPTRRSTPPSRRPTR